MKPEATFTPGFFFQNAYIQTILASLRIRAAGCRTWAGRSRKIIIPTQSGARLQGIYTRSQGNPVPRGLVILLHGWEGSAESTYMLTTGRYLCNQGYDVFRLNYRDHGPTHHLNRELFFATNLDEVFQSVARAAALSNGNPVFLAGFSLGGNFALRIARQCAQTPIAHLARVAAISPVLDPARSTDCIDRIPLFREYFLKKWRRSLRQKESCFPELYRFSDILRAGTCLELTRKLIPYHPTYASTEAYFRGYTLKKDDLLTLPVPTTLITAADDPLIPVNDFYSLNLNNETRRIIHSRGGHNGFIFGLWSETWHERYLARWFTGHTGPGRAHKRL